VADLITWTQSAEGYSMHIGKVNGVHLYTVRGSLAHGDLAKTHPFGLDHRLPFAANRKVFTTVEAAKAYAERHLQAAMLHLGFVRRPEPEPPRPCPRCSHDLKLHDTEGCTVSIPCDDPDFGPTETCPCCERGERRG
jgi:hypothetical protein